MAASDALVSPDREADGRDAPVAKKKDSKVLSGRGGGDSSLSSLSGAHKITVTHSSHTHTHSYTPHTAVRQEKELGEPRVAQTLSRSPDAHAGLFRRWSSELYGIEWFHARTIGHDMSVSLEAHCLKKIIWNEDADFGESRSHYLTAFSYTASRRYSPGRSSKKKTTPK